eukprot:Skav207733  [mRNA]  locus=scaffold362:324153:328160:+ [translate_table: standard]
MEHRTRATSAPPEGAVGNVFWSEKTRRDMELELHRPRDLPRGTLLAALDDDEPGDSSPELQPVRDRDVVGKGKGQSGAGESSMATATTAHRGSASFVTPPSHTRKSIWRRSVQEHGDHHPTGRFRFSEGLMPPSDEKKGDRTMGPIQSGKDDEFSRSRDPHGHAGKGGSADDDGLERAMEKEMVTHLQDENARLTAELEKLRRGSNETTTTGSHGSRIDGSREVRASDIGREVTRTGGQHVRQDTPRRHVTQVNPSAPRFTPNGTRVPDGPPPMDEGSAPMMIPLPPPIPQRRPSKVDMQQYEVMEDERHVRRVDPTWEPVRQRTPRRTKSPREETRQFWLHAGGQRLQEAMDTLNATNPLGPYGREPFTRERKGHPVHGLEPAAVVRDGRAVHSARDSECRDRRAGCYGEGDGDRALHVARDTEHPDHRALHVARDTEHPDHRALHAARDQEYGDTRAGLGARDHDREDDRASRVAREYGLRWEDDHGRPPDDRGRSLRSAVDPRDAYMTAVGGYGYGDPNLPATNPRSAWWIPPFNGGTDIEVVSDDFPEASARGSQLRRPSQPRGGPFGAMDFGGGGQSGKLEIPDLPSDASPVQFGDWLHLTGPAMCDLSNVASYWWKTTMDEACRFYAKWKESTPLQRIQLQPELPVSLLDSRYARTEQRGVNLLLRAVGSELQQTLVTERQLTSTAILFRLHITYQPGGAGEKGLILQQLVSLPKCSTVQDMVTALRSWRRHFGRAREIGAAIPDATLLLKALDPLVVTVGKDDAQASFRLAQSRVALAIDERPDENTIWQFSQCLLAELETMHLKASTSSTTTPIKLKPMDGESLGATDNSKPSTEGNPNANGKGKGISGNASTPCKWFCSDNGCRAGKQCRWLHDLESLPDKTSRCWVCGAKSHRKNECPVRGGQPNKPKTGDGGPPSGGGKRGGGGTSSSSSNANNAASNGGGQPSKTTTPSKPKINEMSANHGVDVASPPSTTDGTTEAKSTADTGSTKVTGEELLKEATQLLKALRGPVQQPHMKTIHLAKLNDAEDGWLLVDSGATHALRPAVSMEEWEGALQTSVALADGVTNRFRLKPGAKLLLTHPSDETPAWIVPMGGLTELGYGITWKDDRCTILDEQGRDVPVRVRHGCPMFEQETGEAIIHRLEQKQLAFHGRIARIQKLLNHVEQRPNSWTPETALTVLMKNVFPELPDDVAARTIPDLESFNDAQLGGKVPWNRRTRRRLEGARHIVLHLFAGKDSRYWTQQLRGDGVEVLCVDLLDNCRANVLDDATYTYLLRLAMTGRLRAIIGEHLSWNNRRTRRTTGVPRMSNVMATCRCGGHGSGLPLL